ncbi:MAG: hypothetical protein K2X03_31220 [Bryobacteraceae bacterium]|nr:hypothetical protein [Bryobacteraceae bacterium]
MSLLLILAATAPAQTAVEVFRKAPPATDAALRERVTKFYQTYIDKKWRLSEPIVAEDSKDRYFAAPKSIFFSYAISEIKFEENYTKAIVLGLAEQERMMAMGGIIRMKVPLQSYWKIIDGQWMWYLPDRTCVATPMGCGVVDKTATEVSDAQKKEIEQRIANPPLNEVLSSFGFTDSAGGLVLSAAAPRLEREFKNKLNGYLAPKVRQVTDSDVEASFEPAQIPPNSTGKLVVKMKPGASFAARFVNVEIEVFTRVFPMRVKIEGPAAKK